MRSANFGRQAALAPCRRAACSEACETALAPPGGHRAAQLVGLAGREAGGDDGQLHDLLLEDRHAAGAFEHGVDRRRYLLDRFLALPPRR